MADMIRYVPNSVANRTIIKKNTGNVSAFSLDSGEVLPERTLPFDTFVQVIDGVAEVIVNDHPVTLEAGQAMIIPAHARNCIKANVRFKMISTVIKSGYEEVIS